MFDSAFARSASLRVLHVLPYCGVGGTEVATLRLMRAMASYGIASSALALRADSTQRDWLHAAQVPFQEISRVPTPSVRHFPRFIQDSWNLARSLRDRQVDLLHCADVTAALFVSAAGRMAGVPVLTHVRNRHDGLSRREKRFLAASHFAFVSQATCRQFAMQVPARRTSVVYDGVELPDPGMLATRQEHALSVRQEFGLAPCTPLIAMFARVNRQKDFPTLINAAARLRGRHPDLRFLIVGDANRVGENRAHMTELETVLAASGTADMFIFTGFRTDVPRLMLAADACVLSTHFEGLPLVLIEAMLMGTPCVATAVDGVPEIISDGATGLTHAHEDAVGLADALDRLLADPTYARALGEAGRVDATSRFGMARLTDLMSSLYAQLAGRE